MDIPSLGDHIVVTYRVGSFLIFVGAWTAIWCGVGFLIGYRSGPIRLIFLPESARKLNESQPDLRTGTSR